MEGREGGGGTDGGPSVAITLSSPGWQDHRGSPRAEGVITKTSQRAHADGPGVELTSSGKFPLRWAFVISLLYRVRTMSRDTSWAH